jgi:hypothetical protein
MRTAILILVIIILAVIAAIATGYLDINQIRGAKAPEVSTTQNGIVTKGGQAPAFDVQTGSVTVGSKETTVNVPALQVKKPGNPAEAGTNNAQ